MIDKRRLIWEMQLHFLFVNRYANSEETINGYTNQRAVYVQVNIWTDQVYEWVFFSKASNMNGLGSKYWLAHPYHNYP